MLVFPRKYVSSWYACSLICNYPQLSLHCISRYRGRCPSRENIYASRICRRVMCAQERRAFLRRRLIHVQDDRSRLPRRDRKCTTMFTMTNKLFHDRYISPREEKRMKLTLMDSDRSNERGSRNLVPPGSNPVAGNRFGDKD